MLGNGIKQTTATTGTGALTLSAVAGMPTLADAFPLNAMLSYTLLDAAGLFIEAGIGYLSAPNTLVRARVTATFAAGVYTSQSATAASLAGTTTVICTPHSATLYSGFPTVDSQSTGHLRYLSSASRNCGFASLTPAANRQVYSTFELKSPVVLLALNFNVNTAGAALSTARMALYSCNEKGYPGVILAGNALAHDTSTTGIRTETLATPLFLPAGWYFTSVACSATPVISAYATGATNIIGGHPFGHVAFQAPIDYRFETLGAAFTTLAITPNPVTTSQSAGSFNQPLVLLGVQ
jgi:hypothetical protein